MSENNYNNYNDNGYNKENYNNSNYNNNYNNNNNYGNNNGNNGYNNGNNGGGNRNNGNQNDKNDNKKMGNGTFIMCLLAAVIVFSIFSFIGGKLKEGTQIEVTYSDFLQMIEQDAIDSVKFTSTTIFITPKGKDGKAYPGRTYYTGVLNDLTIFQRLDKSDIPFHREIQDTKTGVVEFIIFTLLPLILIGLLFFSMIRMISKKSGDMMGVGKSNAKIYVQKETGVTFRDVAGQEEAKESMHEIVDFLHNPAKYTEIGAKLPKGALLVGPPGTGKTLLAKAVAGEANVPFFSLSGSDFVEMFVGVGASRVRDLFKKAQQQAPCIVFIDEIDAIGKSRDSRYGSSNDEREQTLNQLLSEMDGFDSSKGIILLGATNRPEVLDKALLRPGRFDRRIIVEKPDLKGRLDTLKVHSKNVLMDDTVDLDEIALATSGAVGSDLANMINEAAITAARQGRRAVSQKDLFEAVEIVIAGKEKKDRILGDEEKTIVAYHEVGHALITAATKKTEPVQKITIVPRTMGALGYVMQVPEEEKYLMKKDELEAKLVMLLAGRAAEELVFDSVTTGAANDIEKATQIARAMITQYGMSDEFGLMGLETIESKYLEGRSALNCGDATAAKIDEEVKALLASCYEKAKDILTQNREVLDKIAAHLKEKETITGKEFMEIYESVHGKGAETKEDADKLSDGNGEDENE